MPKKPLKDLTAALSRRVIFTAYRGVSLLDLAGPLEAFRIAAAFGGEKRKVPLYDCAVVSARGGAVQTADAVALVTVPVSRLRGKQIDTLVVPGAFGVEDVVRDEALIGWVRSRAGSCRRVASVCAGSFLLAKAGLLSGKTATTHWLHCDALAKKYGKTKVEPDAIFVRDGKIWTSAGVTTGIDMALALIEDDLGREMAMKVARILVVYLKRSGGQSQYSALLAAQTTSEDDEFGALEKWIAENPASDLGVETLADRVHMSPRNFARVYTQRRGRTPAKAVEAIRVDAARRLLEQRNTRVEEVSRRSGFSNDEHMRCAFIRNIGIPPREYKKRFAP